MSYGGHFVMTGRGEGFGIQNIHYSPSSGSGYAIYHTDNDWRSEPALVVNGQGGGGPNCCSMYLSEEVADGGVLVFRENSIWDEPQYLAYESGAIQLHSMGIGPMTSMTCAPVSSALCYAGYVDNTGDLIIVRGIPGGSSILDTIDLDFDYAVDMAFHGADRGCLLVDLSPGGMNVYVTIDSGQTWQLSLDNVEWMRAAEWTDANNIWLIGNHGSIMRSPDAGQTWTNVPIPSTSDLRSISSYSADSIWIAGTGGLILSTGDAGVSWSEHGIDSMNVDCIQTFNGAIYAYTAGGIYRFILPPIDDHTRVGTLAWWSFTFNGVLLRLDDDEVVAGLSLHDTRGRYVPASFTGLEVDMRHLPAGLYVMSLTSNKRLENAKILWPSYDR